MKTHNKTVKFACAKNAHAWTPLTLRHLPQRYASSHFVDKTKSHKASYNKILKIKLSEKPVKAAENSYRINYKIN